MSDTDWNSRPYVTATELVEMPGWRRAWFYDQPNVWRADPSADILRNCAHPANYDFWLRDTMAEVRSAR